MIARTGVVAAVGIGIGVALGALSGCNLGDVIRVKTPRGIQQATGLPASTTLNEAEAEYQRWFADVQADGSAWKANIERSDEIAGMLGQLGMSALDGIGPSVAGVPVLGAALFPALGVGALWLGRWGVAKEKRLSFNKGLEVGAEQTRTAIVTLPQVAPLTSPIVQPSASVAAPVIG